MTLFDRSGRNRTWQLSFRARAATTVVFFATGAVSASWASRIPAIQERLDLSPGFLSVAFAALEGGAVVGLLLGGGLVAHFGSRWSLRVAFSLYPSALLASALAPSLLWLVIAVGVMAAANSVADVAMNAQGVEIQARYRRPVFSRMHAGHGFGVLAGGLCGSAAAAAGCRCRSTSPPSPFSASPPVSQPRAG